MGHPPELEYGRAGRWSPWLLGKMGLQAGYCISKSGRGECHHGRGQSLAMESLGQGFGLCTVIWSHRENRRSYSGR
ncbi:hypothetical protein CRG98_038804 [Punica granatum]|uniref:Uncharacterized protein n=1 Tax=Punica granatum TaxID=22663 RepID=A0A2I0IAI5_PUNGR|nr:hypothetical protein CRG98_038804 [Punica granatum]